ncbi:MAG: hypothetical protein A2504_12410 [Bdellovibrionales bacterium RIFOXYD12_FULL_39_22]|nr:MAG: hypothetical protein A2385_15900 [Bdellovibrionales bacterium RIFOXYB1_FULL_39_21]OFZ40683.1 MAG: hypothetical protein A2485_04545 [Bdellovibrionales bacterium RIFOXYC12_FULL_39_17]OFZ49719.1 MAG: hypothetical protein A2404_01535 [Bdellovibrionales bacterium RIFOXYC1_FULL_39_130]OFZ77267.1 MAG: hypothetical protein A2560_11755 [Bdellovibrionales bacterium RIFOXYD1_FULL_39_84]OFZ91779.1 MAG: hypothetical protein A2504_12410 [Bdellovibrionales bacterium RIFOXYD12_FULL_39_22]HLE13093.1 tr
MKKDKNQLRLKGMSGHGGSRIGSGRPKSSKFISHVERPRIKRNMAIHVNLHLKESLTSINLRTKDFFKLFRQAVKTARRRGLRIVHYSLMHNHLHLIIEAANNEELSKGMQSFALSLSKLVNYRVSGRIKKLWQDRYWMRLLSSPREIKIALQYVLKNPQKKFSSPTVMDLYSSVLAMSGDVIKKLFPDLRFHPPPDLIARFNPLKEEILHRPSSYLLKQVLS